MIRYAILFFCLVTTAPSLMAESASFVLQGTFGSGSSIDNVPIPDGTPFTVRWETVANAEDSLALNDTGIFDATGTWTINGSQYVTDSSDFDSNAMFQSTAPWAKNRVGWAPDNGNYGGSIEFQYNSNPNWDGDIISTYPGTILSGTATTLSSGTSAFDLVSGGQQLIIDNTTVNFTSDSIPEVVFFLRGTFGAGSSIDGVAIPEDTPFSVAWATAADEVDDFSSDGTGIFDSTGIWNINGSKYVTDRSDPDSKAFFQSWAPWAENRLGWSPDSGTYSGSVGFLNNSNPSWDGDVLSTFPGTVLSDNPTTYVSGISTFDLLVGGSELVVNNATVSFTSNSARDITASNHSTDIDGDDVIDLFDPCPSDPLDQCDPSGSTAEEVEDSAGATISTPDGGLVLDIDPGDLATDQTISVTETVINDPETDIRLSANAGAGQAVAAFDLQPDGLQFASPVTLTIIADVSALNPRQRNNLDLYLLDETSGAFEALMASCLVTEDPVEAFTAVCSKEVGHFSTYGLIAPLDSDGDDVFDQFGVEVDACPLENATGFDVDGDGCIDSFQGLTDLVQTLVAEGVISSNMQNSLLAKVNAATESSAEADACEAIDELGAFINQVSAQTGKKISPEAAHEVSDYASSVIAYLGSNANCS